MTLKLRNWKVVAVIAGVVAVAALTVVLVQANIAARDADVVARVNGERITSQDVAELQASYQQYYDVEITTGQALEQLITQKVLYQEARHKGHLLTMEEAEQELHAQLGAANLTPEDFRAQLDVYGVSYDEYVEHYRKQTAIEHYLTAEVPVVEVTEEEARELYNDYVQQFPDEEFPPFEEMESYMTSILEQERQQEAQEAMLLLIEQLREEADIQIYT